MNESFSVKVVFYFLSHSDQSSLTQNQEPYTTVDKREGEASRKSQLTERTELPQITWEYDSHQCWPSIPWSTPSRHKKKIASWCLLWLVWATWLDQWVSWVGALIIGMRTSRELFRPGEGKVCSSTCFNSPDTEWDLEQNFQHFLQWLRKTYY